VIIVRQATPDDIPWLLGQLPGLNALFGSRCTLIPTDEYARAFLPEIIGAHPFFIASDESGPVGFIAGILMPHPLNPAVTVLSEQFWWVSVDAKQRAKVGVVLLDAFEACGREKAQWTVMTLQSSNLVGASLLQRRGFREQERSYLLEVN
jgi:hypothetical protein